MQVFKKASGTLTVWFCMNWSHFIRLTILPQLVHELSWRSARGKGEKKAFGQTLNKRNCVCSRTLQGRPLFKQVSETCGRRTTWLSWQGRCSGVIVCFVDISILWQSAWFYWSNGFPSLLSGSLSFHRVRSDHCKRPSMDISQITVNCSSCTNT